MKNFPREPETPTKAVKLSTEYLKSCFAGLPDNLARIIIADFLLSRIGRDSLYEHACWVIHGTIEEPEPKDE